MAVSPDEEKNVFFIPSWTIKILYNIGILIYNVVAGGEEKNEEKTGDILGERLEGT